MADEQLHVLLIEDNKDFAKLVQVFLQRYEKDRFTVVWKENHSDAMAELTSGSHVDIILMDYFLPGKNGLEIAREIVEKKVNIPIVFLTVNKDFDLALEVMKLGAADYLVKEEIQSPVLPKTILNVIEKHRLKNRLMEAEVSRERLRTIHQTLGAVMHDFERPLHAMRAIATSMKEEKSANLPTNYVTMIDENVRRIEDRLQRLKTLEVYKTVKYIKDIKMLDLS